ncbi:MAG: peptidoglycan editing factor PgeF [Anaerobacillus sp.]|uniref:peptidoglycan editing factor PgeF n=1 Tax=Anaerobacillus sp. TaxID=1872506 RepID=UPI00391CEA5F
MNNEPFVRSNSSYLTVQPFQQLSGRVIAGFSTRENGYSIAPYNSLNLGLHVQDNDDIVIANRKKLASDLGIALNKWVFSEQVHGNNIKKVTQKDCSAGTLIFSNSVLATDGLYTNDKNVLLASLYADCVPLYFYAPTYNMVGLAHAGWKGSVGRIGPKMVQCWTGEEQIPVEAIHVAIGPSISAQNYEVDEFVINKVKKVITSHPYLPYKETKPNKFSLNLKELNKQLLMDVGIKEEKIVVSNYCTFEKTDLFFSYRRKQRTGRMMSFIGRV